MECNVSSKVVLVFLCKSELSSKAGDIWILISIKLLLSDSVAQLHHKSIISDKLVYLTKDYYQYLI